MLAMKLVRIYFTHTNTGQLKNKFAQVKNIYYLYIMEHIQTKIDEVYNVALQLGVSNASEHEKAIFKTLIKQLVISTIDDARNKVTDLLFKEANNIK